MSAIGTAGLAQKSRRMARTPLCFRAIARLGLVPPVPASTDGHPSACSFATAHPQSTDYRLQGARRLRSPYRVRLAARTGGD